MAVTKAEIIAQVSKNLLGDSSTYTWAQIYRAVSKFFIMLSERSNWPDLHIAGTSSITLTDGTTYIAHPDNYKDLDAIVINDGTYDNRPLKEITYEAYLKRRSQEPSTSYDEPKRFARRGKFFWLDPIAATGYTAKLHYWRKHPGLTSATADGSEIIFGDEFEPVIMAGATLYVAKAAGMLSKVQEFTSEVSQALSAILPAEDKNVESCNYIDV